MPAFDPAEDPDIDMMYPKPASPPPPPLLLLLQIQVLETICPHPYHYPINN